MPYLVDVNGNRVYACVCVSVHPSTSDRQIVHIQKSCEWSLFNDNLKFQVGKPIETHSFKVLQEWRQQTETMESVLLCTPSA